MINSVMSICAECITSLAAEAGINSYKKSVDERSLRLEIKKHLESQRKFNEVCMLSEEIDFEGLINFLMNTCIEDFENCIFSTSKKDRGLARGRVLSAAVS